MFWVQFDILTCKAEDAAVISTLACAAYEATWGHEMARDHLDHIYATELSAPAFTTAVQQDVVLGAKAGDVWAGYIHFGHFERSEHLEEQAADAGEIRRLYLLETYHNQGLGSQLLEAALAHPTMAERSEVYLHVWETNPGARRLYERYGFVQVGERPEYNPAGEYTGCDYIMRWRRRA